MSIPEIVRRSIHPQLVDFCMRIVPAKREGIDLANFRIRDDRITLFLETPAWTEPVIRKRIVGQFRYEDESATWRCRLMLEDRKWTLLHELEPVHSFAEFLRRVETDFKGAYACRMLQTVNEEFCIVNNLGPPEEI
jgi:hypothetical protein